MRTLNAFCCCVVLYLSGCASSIRSVPVSTPVSMPTPDPDHKWKVAGGIGVSSLLVGFTGGALMWADGPPAQKRAGEAFLGLSAVGVVADIVLLVRASKKK